MHTRTHARTHAQPHIHKHTHRHTQTKKHIHTQTAQHYLECVGKKRHCHGNFIFRFKLIKNARMFKAGVTQLFGTTTKSNYKLYYQLYFTICETAE